ncbi:glucan ABC transporter ATP-binding protein/ permease [Pinisolibacter aquiterrae]|uniref:glucan ABC transporter ATP-binding protein/ permease n=1 Tax=Pinisolibacter aquiterrae TaxID=2815579 RepID=UPI001C3E8699|nr:glucan ABC transporter ATP-binding protein/ permease [Pinisolibacter aquiterrae]MBV5266639.1 glucan ABC transporter ATP-binding protein/ permease [Pinisolibacter aquiterrae]MCC8233657.1 glucan ABC transporter ATP-binding protein/ permease [Pinisolibacter aquiterrae]
MSFFRLYFRAVALVGPDKGLAAGLAVAGIVLAFLGFAEPILFGRVVDALTHDRPAMTLVALWAGLGFLGIAAGIFVSLHADRLAHRRRLEVMKSFFEHVIQLPASFHSDEQSGRLIAVMLRGTDHLFSLLLSVFREHLTAVVMLVALIPVSIWMNWRMGLLLVALMVVYGTLSVIVVRKTRFGQERAESYHAQLSGRVVDVIGNVSVVQSFTRLQDEARALQSIMGNLIAAQFPVLNWWALASVLTRAAATITIVSLFALGTALHAKGEITVGEIVSFVGFATMLIGRLDQLTQFLSTLVFEAAGMRQFFEVLDRTSTLAEEPNAPALVVTGGRVVFDRVTFRYPRSTSGIFDVSFVAEPGETLAIVGPTGSGKSTALALLQRVRDPDEGRITIDGQDLRDVTLDSIRRAIGVVFQDPGLFDRSIAENLRIGKPDATDDEIRAAARLAEASGFIEGKQGGYDTRAGERGRGLSGGERQRLAIARAVLKNAPVLILDEATSALDNETELKIKRALETLSKNRTTFVIAHRLSTVRSADQILYMEAGRILERGRFDDLVAAKGRFAALVEAGELQDEEADAAQSPG